MNSFAWVRCRAANPGDAYFVKCGRETMTQNDINLGVINIEVGLSPVKLAEFVVIRTKQLAGQPGS